MEVDVVRVEAVLRHAAPRGEFGQPHVEQVRFAQDLESLRWPRCREQAVEFVAHAHGGQRGEAFTSPGERFARVVVDAPLELDCEPRLPQRALPRTGRSPGQVLHALLFATLIVAAGTSAAVAAPADSTAARPAWPTARVRAWQTGAVRSDRLQHASLSFALAAAATTISGREGAAFAGTLLLGVGKEAWDARRGRFDTGDLAADLAGAALGTWAGSAIRR